MDGHHEDDERDLLRLDAAARGVDERRERRLGRLGGRALDQPLRARNEREAEERAHGDAARGGRRRDAEKRRARGGGGRRGRTVARRF